MRNQVAIATTIVEFKRVKLIATSSKSKPQLIYSCSSSQKREKKNKLKIDLHCKERGKKSQS